MPQGQIKNKSKQMNKNPEDFGYTVHEHIWPKFWSPKLSLRWRETQWTVKSREMLLIKKNKS